MRLLLDTMYLYKMMHIPPQLSESERTILSDPTNHLYVSSVSVWEMRLKFQARYPSGKRKSPFDPIDVVAALKRHSVRFLSMTEQHASKPLVVPLQHNDPFDQMLTVQSQEEDLRLLTNDRLLRHHPLAFFPNDPQP